MVLTWPASLGICTSSIFVDDAGVYKGLACSHNVFHCGRSTLLGGIPATQIHFTMSRSSWAVMASILAFLESERTEGCDDGVIRFVDSVVAGVGVPDSGVDGDDLGWKFSWFWVRDTFTESESSAITALTTSLSSLDRCLQSLACL